jgi:hypothetical protein
MKSAAIAASLCLALSASVRAAEADDAYRGMSLVGGESHQHAATLVMIERVTKDPPLPGFGARLHENGSAADAYDAMRRGGYDWGSVSHHDTNFPGQMANICIDPASEKYQWWLRHVSKAGFPDATSTTGAAVSPPSNEALALSKVATSKTVEGEGGFLAFTGREFTNTSYTPSGVGAREGGHKIVILPGETLGMCAGDGQLNGDEYCRDEYRLYRWIATAPGPQAIVIQAHPRAVGTMDLRPVHPKNAPGGFSDAFVQGIEVSSANADPEWEQNYQRALQLGYRLFPAFGSDSHNATWPGNEASARKSATLCWVPARTRVALIEAMHARRCYYATSWKPELRFEMRSAGGGEWVPMGALLSAPDGKVELRAHAINDPRNANVDPRFGKRFDLIELVDSQGRVPLFAPCTRAADGHDVCTLEAADLHLADGAFYTRIRMKDPKPEGCRSAAFPKLLPDCEKVVIGGAIYVNWDRYVAATPYRACRFGRDDAPCETPGCLPPNLDRDQDGYPDGCDVCPDLANPDQADANKDGYGDACPRH